MALVGGDVGTVVLFQFRQGAKDFRHIFLEFGSAHLGGLQNMLPVSKALQRFRILLQYITGCSCGCCMYPTYNIIGRQNGSMNNILSNGFQAASVRISIAFQSETSPDCHTVF